MEPGQRLAQKTEEEVWNAISAFEQILEAMPNDRVALETLYEAYEMIGDHAHALEYLIRLTDIIVDESDIDAAPKVLSALEKLAGDDPDGKKALERIMALTTNEGEVSAAIEPQVKTKQTPKNKSATIDNQLTMAWNLMQAGELDNDEYSMIVQDLTETWSKDVGVPATVLHVLDDRQSKSLNKVLNFLSKDTGCPLIALSHFDLQPELVEMLPQMYLTNRGAIVFEVMADEVLVAILNPYDQDLQEEIKELIGKPCHFYLVTADEYNNIAESIRKMKEPVVTAG